MIKSVFIAIIWITALLPLPMPGQNGAYNTLSGMLWCEEEINCYHEIAHKLDHTAGWVSGGDDFYNALQIYLFSELRLSEPEELAIALLRYAIQPQPKYEFFRQENAEIYALIFEHAQGRRENMPPIFWEFYDWELAAVYVERYAR